MSKSSILLNLLDKPALAANTMEVWKSQFTAIIHKGVDYFFTFQRAAHRYMKRKKGGVLFFLFVCFILMFLVKEFQSRMGIRERGICSGDLS